MKKILITGSSGMLGSSAMKILKDRYKCIGVDRNDSIYTNYRVELSLREEVNKLFNDVNPDYVLHCAAMIDVDKCESNKILAEVSNIDATYKLTNACRVYGSKMIYISTNMVFDGTREMSYSENDYCAPINNYARTKYYGEKIVLTLNDSLIVRTNILGMKINSFFYWIMNKINNNENIELWDDIYFNAIGVNDLVEYIEKIINQSGVYHITSTDYISKYDFGMMLKNKLNKSTNIVKSHYNSEIKRPKNAVLDCNKYQKETGIKLPTIEQTMNKMIEEYNEIYS